MRLTDGRSVIGAITIIFEISITGISRLKKRKNTLTLQLVYECLLFCFAIYVLIIP